MDIFVESLGFEPVLSEKGDIAYSYDRPLDESCYREVDNSDIFVLIVGGRYGSEASTEAKRPDKNFFERYESITKKEYDSAVHKDIPVYILIEKGVYGEYQTFARNKNIENIRYAHVDSVNVFIFIEDILAKNRNNPIKTFEKFEEIESWLREQWSGLFRELLRRQSQQQQLSGLAEQIVQLKETNETLKKYLEALMKGAGKNESSKLIESEKRRLLTLRQLSELSKNSLVEFFMERHGIALENISDAIRAATSPEDFISKVTTSAGGAELKEWITGFFDDYLYARADLNDARIALGLPIFEIPVGLNNFPFVKKTNRRRKEVARDLKDESLL